MRRDGGTRVRRKAPILFTAHRITQATQRDRHTCLCFGKHPNILQPRSILPFTSFSFCFPPPPPTLNTFPLFFSFFYTHCLSTVQPKICLHIRIFPAFNFQHRQRSFSQPTNENQQKSPKLGILNRDNNLYSFPNASNIHLPNNKCPANRPALTIS